MPGKVVFLDRSHGSHGSTEDGRDIASYRDTIDACDRMPEKNVGRVLSPRLLRNQLCRAMSPGCLLRLMGTRPPGGGLAQLGEHDVRNVGVAGSTPVPSTTVVDHAEIP